MRGEVERADSERRGVFPKRWGTPHGTAFSEERAIWVANTVRRHMIAMRSTTEQRQAELERKRRTP